MITSLAFVVVRVAAMLELPAASFVFEPSSANVPWELGFISTARSFQLSAVPSVHEKLVTVLAESGPFLLDAPEFAEPAMLHCCVVDAPFVRPPPFELPATSLTQAFAFAFVMLTVAGEVVPPALSFLAVVGTGGV